VAGSGEDVTPTAAPPAVSWGNVVENTNLLETLWQLLVNLWFLVVGVGAVVVRYGLVIAWVVWWLWAVNWNKAWPVLARGAWAPVLLLLLTVALVWSRLAPSDCDCLALVTVPNFWWQLGAVGLLAAIALFCGWLQGVFGWAPAEVSLEPPPDEDLHGHEHPVGTDHGHEAAHSEEPEEL
jgi:hypothetical protein